MDGTANGTREFSCNLQLVPRITTRTTTTTMCHRLSFRLPAEQPSSERGNKSLRYSLATTANSSSQWAHWAQTEREREREPRSGRQRLEKFFQLSALVVAFLGPLFQCCRAKSCARKLMGKLKIITNTPMWSRARAVFAAGRAAQWPRSCQFVCQSVEV